MSLDTLLWIIREAHWIIVSRSELWVDDETIRPGIRRAFRRHRKGIAALMCYSAIDVCPSRDLHRPYWRYAGDGDFTCEVCERLRPEVERVA